MGGRGGKSGLKGPVSKAVEMLPDGTDSLRKSLESGGPTLSGSSDQVARAESARYDAQYTMIETVMKKNRVGADVLQDISDGRAAMQKGVESRYSSALRNFGNKSIALEHAKQMAQTYKNVVNDLKRVENILQKKTTASWWLKNQYQAAFRRYIETEKSISEMEKNGWFRR